MNRVRWWIMGTGLAGRARVPAGWAREKARAERPQRGEPPAVEAMLQRLTQLLPPEARERLNLSDEQKEKIADLQKEFEDKNKETLGKARADLDKAREALDKARQEGDREAAQKAGGLVREAMNELQKIRGPFQGRVVEVLTDDQRRQLREWMSRAPGRGPEGTPAAGGRQPGVPPGANALLMPFVQAQLNLSDEQKEKITRLHREFEEKLLAVLTDEQKKEFEEMQRRGPGSGQPRPGTPGRPGAAPEAPPDRTPNPPRGERPGARLPEGVRELPDLVYARPGGKPLLLDLYLPARRAAPAPVILWVHGGGWKAGDRKGGPAMPLVAHGYAVASIDYRLSQEAIFPAQIEDCKAAVRWLRGHAREYHLDGDRIGAWGASAGGHLVALLGTSGGVKDLEGKEGDNPDQSSRVQAVCDWFGPADLGRLGGESKGAESPVTELLGGPVQDNKEKADRASPVNYVSKDAPPFLIMHGDQDHLVPLTQSQELCDDLKKAGVEATLHVVKGAGHGFGGPEVMQLVEDFFDKHLKKEATKSRPSASD